MHVKQYQRFEGPADESNYRFETFLYDATPRQQQTTSISYSSLVDSRMGIYS